MKYCKKCSARYFEKEEECKYCHIKLSNKEIIALSFISKLFSKKLLLPVVVISLISISSLFLSSSTGAATKQCKEMEETYSEEVPYEVDGVYPYYPKYNILSSSLAEKWSSQLGSYYSYEVALENADTDDYYYTIQYVVEASEHGRTMSTVRKQLKTRSNDLFIADFDTELGEKVDGRFVVYPEPVQKIGKIIRLENRSFTRKTTKC